jgi:hypothetical protein
VLDLFHPGLEERILFLDELLLLVFPFPFVRARFGFVARRTIAVAGFRHHFSSIGPMHNFAV